MRIVIILFIIFAIILGMWSILWIRTPKLETSLIDIKVTSPDNKWEECLETKDVQQLEFTFEVENKYSKSIPLFGVYSKKLNKLALATRHINTDFHQELGRGEKKKFTICYLVNDKNVLGRINLKKDFKVYASFVNTLVWDSVENTWRGSYVVAPFFGVGFSKIQ